ncbi:hypothetical protein JYT76_00615 [Olleya sp. AH-315-F22]|nr:hypothetical protein [Olleya sp. AH-315-F22]
MRYLCVLICSFFLLSCNAKQKTLLKNKIENTSTICPQDGACTFEVLQNKSLKLLKDGIGELYPDISEGDKIILKFQYKRNEIPNTVDGHYSELIYVELDPNNLNIELENSELQEVKLLFARLCFCRGQTGYYKVKKGSLSIIKENENYQFKLEFKNDEVPQVITSINEFFVVNK